MSFLKIKALRLDCKDKLAKKDGNPDKEDSRSIHDKKENSDCNEQRMTYKILNSEEFWRVPKQAQFAHIKHKPMTMSPVATNVQKRSRLLPKLVPLQKDDRNATDEINEKCKGKSRSTSVLGCSYAPTRIRKQKVHLPEITDLQSLSMKENEKIKSFVVQGKKFGSSGSLGALSFPDSSDNDSGFSNSESKVIDKNLSESVKTNGKTESKKEHCHGNDSGDLFPPNAKTGLYVKTAYANYSGIFNTYLQSRFGKRVFVNIHKKANIDAGKKYQIYWAPVLINKKVLYNRTNAADSTQESYQDARTTKQYFR